MSELNFSTLSVFSTDDLVPKTVTMFDNGEPVEGTVYVKRLPSIEIDRFAQESRDADREVRVNAVPRLLSKAIRRADGGAHLSVDAAGKLTNANRAALLKVATEVNKEQDASELGN